MVPTPTQPFAEHEVQAASDQHNTYLCHPRERETSLQDPRGYTSNQAMLNLAKLGSSQASPLISRTPA